MPYFEIKPKTNSDTSLKDITNNQNHNATTSTSINNNTNDYINRFRQTNEYKLNSLKLAILTRALGICCARTVLFVFHLSLICKVTRWLIYIPQLQFSKLIVYIFLYNLTYCVGFCLLQDTLENLNVVPRMSKMFIKLILQILMFITVSLILSGISSQFQSGSVLELLISCLICGRFSSISWSQSTQLFDWSSVSSLDRFNFKQSDFKRGLKCAVRAFVCLYILTLFSDTAKYLIVNSVNILHKAPNGKIELINTYNAIRHFNHPIKQLISQRNLLRQMFTYLTAYYFSMFTIKIRRACERLTQLVYTGTINNVVCSTCLNQFDYQNVVLSSYLKIIVNKKHKPLRNGNFLHDLVTLPHIVFAFIEEFTFEFTLLFINFNLKFTTMFNCKTNSDFNLTSNSSSVAHEITKPLLQSDKNKHSIDETASDYKPIMINQHRPTYLLPKETDLAYYVFNKVYELLRRVTFGNINLTDSTNVETFNLNEQYKLLHEYCLNIIDANVAITNFINQQPNSFCNECCKFQLSNLYNWILKLFDRQPITCGCDNNKSTCSFKTGKDTKITVLRVDYLKNAQSKLPFDLFNLLGLSKQLIDTIKNTDEKNSSVRFDKDLYNTFFEKLHLLSMKLIILALISTKVISKKC